jgi:hypothetical protein
MSDVPPYFPDDFYAVDRLGRWPRPRIRFDKSLPPLPPQPTLSLALCTIAGAALYAAAVCALGLLAVLLAFCATVGMLVIPTHGKSRPAKFLAIDVMSGVVLPFSCLVFDPGIFSAHLVHGDTPLGFFSFPEQIFAYTLIGSEMLALLCWLFLGRWLSNFGRDAAVGALALGCAICVPLALAVAALGALGVALGLFTGFANGLISLLGLLPICTFWTFYCNAWKAAQGRAGAKKTTSHLLGFIIPVALAAAVAVAAHRIAPDAPPIVRLLYAGPYR